MDIKKEVPQYLCSVMATLSEAELGELIRQYGVTASLDGRGRDDLFDAAWCLQEKKDLPDWMEAVDPSRFTTDDTKLFHFDWAAMTAAEVVVAIRKEGYEPASLEQLRAFRNSRP